MRLMGSRPSSFCRWRSSSCHLRFCCASARSDRSALNSPCSSGCAASVCRRSHASHVPAGAVLSRCSAGRSRYSDASYSSARRSSARSASALAARRRLSASFRASDQSFCASSRFRFFAAAAASAFLRLSSASRCAFRRSACSSGVSGARNDTSPRMYWCSMCSSFSCRSSRFWSAASDMRGGVAARAARASAISLSRAARRPRMNRCSRFSSLSCAATRASRFFLPRIMRSRLSTKCPASLTRGWSSFLNIPRS